MALLTQGAGAFARRTGTCPPASASVAAAKACTRPVRVGDEVDHRSARRTWEIPGWVRQAAGQSATEAGKLATGVEFPAGRATGRRARGWRRGATGVSTGISSKAGAAIAQARALVAQVKAILSSWGSTARWASAEVGGGLMRGIAQGIAKGMPEVQGAARKSKRG